MRDEDAGAMCLKRETHGDRAIVVGKWALRGVESFGA
jgi:hypothetical protein